MPPFGLKSQAAIGKLLGEAVAGSHGGGQRRERGEQDQEQGSLSVQSWDAPSDACIRGPCDSLDARGAKILRESKDRAGRDVQHLQWPSSCTWTGRWPAASWAGTRPRSRSCSTASSRACTALRWRGCRGDPEAARDIVQQTFCQAIERLDTYRGEAALYTWFCQICRNVLADHYRRNGRSGSRVVLLEDLPNARAVLESLAAPAADEPETGALREQVHRIVEATLDALPGRYGEALEWKYIDGLSVREIAARLELGEKAAESLLTRARESFRDAIGGMI